MAIKRIAGMVASRVAAGASARAKATPKSKQTIGRKLVSTVASKASKPAAKGSKPTAKVPFVSARKKMSAKDAKLTWLKNRGKSKRGEGN